MALASGVVADIATAAERGKWMGFTYAGSVLGPAVGPLLGGILAEFLGWRAIFWFLVILASANRNPAEEQDAPSKSFVFSFHYPRQGKNQEVRGSLYGPEKAVGGRNLHATQASQHRANIRTWRDH